MRPEFAKRVIDSNIAFIGPPTKVIQQMRDKLKARQCATAARLKVSNRFFYSHLSDMRYKGMELNAFQDFEQSFHSHGKMRFRRDKLVSLC